MRKHFDRTRVGEGRLNKPSQVDIQRLLDIAYIGYCDGASFGGVMMMGMTMGMMMGMMMGILFSRSVDIHVDKCLRFCRGVPKFCGARSSVYRHAVKGILITISSVLAVSN